MSEDRYNPETDDHGLLSSWSEEGDMTFKVPSSDLVAKAMAAVLSEEARDEAFRVAQEGVANAMEETSRVFWAKMAEVLRTP